MNQSSPFRLPPPAQPEAPPGIQMGLGSSFFAPGAPAGFRWAGEIAAPDGTKHHILVWETVTGTTAVSLSPDALRQLADQCRAKASGLAIEGVVR